MVKAYGGGGFLAQQCRLDGREPAAVARAVRSLPLSGRIVRTRPERQGMYVPKPSFIVAAGRHLETFAQSEMPVDARPFVEHLVRTISAREGHCTRTFEQRR